MVSNLRLFILLLIVLFVTLLLLPLQLLAFVFSKKLSRTIPVLWHKFVLYVVGVKVHVHGTVSTIRPLMLVSNHISWSDILILGSVMPLSFIAKDEVKSWPGINYLAKLQRTVFVNRNRRADVANQTNSIASRLLQGDAIVLFAEGTTGDGNKIMPYKSSLFGAPQSALVSMQENTNAHNNDTADIKIAIQPIAIAYNKAHGLPLGRFHQHLCAWPGDIELVPHLVRFFKTGAFDVDVHFGSEHFFEEGTKRKQIAKEVFDETRQMFTHSRRL